MNVRTDQIAETLVGAVVLAVATGFLVFAVGQAGASVSGDGQRLVAYFDRADGVAVGTDVKMSGVKVGAVSEIGLDPDVGYQAVVELSVDRRYAIPDDSVAKVASDGLLGGAYIAIDPGGSETFLTDQPDEEGLVRNQFESTQGSVDLITLLAGFASQSQNAGASPPAQEELVP